MISKSPLPTSWFFVDEIINHAIKLGGMPSAEHGIGSLKRNYLKPALDAKAVELMQDIKRLFDPQNILNPGKLFPEHKPDKE